MKELYSPAVISGLLKKYELAPLKKLGQNFLKDGHIVEKIAQAAVEEGGAVLEVGPGLGVLTSALASVSDEYYKAARVDGTSRTRIFFRITLPMISPMIVYLVITGFIGAFKAYSDAVALFGTDLNAAGMNTIVGYVYDMLYGDSGGYPSYASAAAIILFVIVLTITCVNLLVTRKQARD